MTSNASLVVQGNRDLTSSEIISMHNYCGDSVSGLERCDAAEQALELGPLGRGGLKSSVGIKAQVNHGRHDSRIDSHSFKYVVDLKYKLEAESTRHTIT